MEITVCIPTHSSTVSTPPYRSKQQGFVQTNLSADSIDTKISQTKTLKHSESSDAEIDLDTPTHIHALHIQCHYDRIVWNVFHPIFIAAELDLISGIKSSPAVKSAFSAIQCLLVNFQNQIYGVKVKESRKRKRNLKSDNNSPCIEEKADQEELDFHAHYSSWTFAFDHTRAKMLIKKRMHGHEVSSDLCMNSNGTKASVQVLIFILPPCDPSESFTEQIRNINTNTLRPEQIFTSALVQQENLNIKLQTLNAFVATMGGGFFLCRFLSTAVKLAQYQRRIALALDDIQLAMKCTVNEAYNYIHAGKIDHAERLIEGVKKDASSRKDKLILGMCDAALWFGSKVRSTQLKERVLSGGKQATVDDFLRIRIMRNRNIRESNLKIE